MVCKSGCKTGFKRARQPEQKEQRKAAILESAAVLLETEGFDKVSLNGIARHAGVAKSNIYRYFESREDIYLQLLKKDWSEWLDNLESSLGPYENSNDANAMATLLAEQVAAAPRMCQLISVLASVLENNLSEEVLLGFKLESVNLGMRLIASIHKCLPNIQQANLLPSTQSIIALIAGLWPLANPNPVVEKVMKRPELAPFKMEFKSALENAIKLTIKGAMFE